MKQDNKRVRVLYSFPHKLGADRICTTAWYQVWGLAKAGADMLVFPGAITRSLFSPNVKIHTTLAKGRLRIPYKILGSMRAFALHDYIVSKHLKRLVGKIDIIHAWPLGALRTLEAATRLGIPAVLERPNAHTRFAYNVVEQECQRLGVMLPRDHEHAYKKDVLLKEEAEYNRASKLLCPSDFVAQSFLDLGYPSEKLARHQYGFDDQVYYPSVERHRENSGLIMLFVGGCAPRKGLHYALEAWLKSTASRDGKFLIAGEFVPGYAEKLSAMLSHPSIRVLGHRTDVPSLMRKSDILVLSSIEEGSALVTSEARGSGCVLLVSEAAGAICEPMKNALVHRVGDVSTLAEHINLLDKDRAYLNKLRQASLERVPEITWAAAGVKLLQVYREAIATYARN